jgi:dihydroorotate dehydrogenase electron transfer subunit
MTGVSSTTPAPPTRRQFTGVVSANTPLCREHFRLDLHVTGFPKTNPGQFIQVACRDLDRDDEIERELEWRPGTLAGTDRAAADPLVHPQAMLRRPFSLAGRRDLGDGATTELSIIHRVVGVGTAWLAQLRPGDPVGLIGPLGNRFDLPAPDQLAVLVGGGVGIPPMLYLAEALALQPNRTAPVVAFAGAVTRELLPLKIIAASPPPDSVEPLMLVEEFAHGKVAAVISTDDGSFGFRGFVTQALERWLDMRQQRDIELPTSLPSSPLAPRPSPLVLHTCGPEAMMKRVAEIAQVRGLDCQVAVERAMACGMGTCQSCCIRVRKPDPAKPPLAGSDWCWRLACTDGPIFRAADLLW